MKVRIKQAGTYSRFGLPHGKVGAQTLVAGDVVELPDGYVAELIDKGMMEEYVEPSVEKDVEPAPKRKPRRKVVVPKASADRHVPEVTIDEAFGVGKRK